MNKFLDGFNNWFNKLIWKISKSIESNCNQKSRLPFVMLIVFCVGIWFLNNSLPSGFIPNEDQGMFYAIIQTPPGSTLERTNQVSERLQKIAEGIEGVKSVSSLAGYEILTEGTGANSEPV